MISNDDKIYSMSALLKEARDGFFPFRSRYTILKLIKQKKIPAHYTKIGQRYKNWWFISSELYNWLQNSNNGTHKKNSKKNLQKNQKSAK